MCGLVFTLFHIIIEGKCGWIIGGGGGGKLCCPPPKLLGAGVPPVPPLPSGREAEGQTNSNLCLASENVSLSSHQGPLRWYLFTYPNTGV